MLIKLYIILLGLAAIPESKSQLFLVLLIPLIVWLFSARLGLIAGKSRSYSSIAHKGPTKTQCHSHAGLRKSHYLFLNIRMIKYFLWLITEILTSTFKVMKVIWRKNLNIDSAFEWIAIEKLDTNQAVIYGNSVTLTPGTVTLDMQNGMLLVHALEQSSIDDLKTGAMLGRIKKIVR